MKLLLLLLCRNCKKETQRAIRCQHCDACPVCADKGFLATPESEVVPCYNCNPDGMEELDD